MIPTTSRSAAIARTALRPAVSATRASFATDWSLSGAQVSTESQPIPGTGTVNGRHLCNPPNPPPIVAKSNATGTPSRKHWDENWDRADIEEAFQENVGFTWGAAGGYKKLPLIRSGEGIYLHDADGKKWMDWTSQAVCSNLGHTVPDSIQAAVTKQMNECAMVYSGLGHVEVRGRLSKLFAEICPGDINGFMFPSSGNEANECAIRMARRFTGKQKIMTRYRSYHGGSGNTLTMTGDYRRHFQQQDAPGMVKFFDPTPLNFSWGRDEETDALQSLAALNDQIMAEGPDTIAAIFIETVPGSAGVLIPPKGYIEGVRALCDKHGILMIADEVMVGFGRTGQMFGFQNFEGVVPDIVTFAKGISGAYLPLSGVGYRQEIKDFFDVNPLGWGATYNAHPVAMACGYETMKYLLDKDIVGHAKSMEVVMKEELQKLVTKHAVVKQARCLGLFGCMDFANPDGSLIQNVGEAPGEKTLAFKAKMADVGLYAFFRPPQFHCAPPLIITEEELRDGFSRVDECLEVFSE